MITILINSNNTMLVSNKTEHIMQHSKNAHHIRIYVEKNYNGWDMNDFSLSMELKLPAGNYKTILLTKTDESAKTGYVQYDWDLNSEYTVFAGQLVLQPTFTYVDASTAKTYVRKTQSCNLTIESINNWADLVTDECLGALDQALVQLQSQVNAVTAASEIYSSKKADNIAIVQDENGESFLSLKSNGKEVGDKLSINELGDSIADNTVDGLITMLI